jgi:hypothetical protein
MTPDAAPPPVPQQAPTAVIPPAVYAVVPPREPKSPLLALVLSVVFPAGGGQLYNGQISKAFAFLAAFVGTIYMTSEVDPMPFAFFIPFLYFYSLIDAWRSATIINARAAGRPPQPEVEDDSDSPAWGLVLVGIGLLLLLNNLGWLELVSLRRFWPVVLIIVGVVFLRRALARREAAAGTGAEPRRDETV